MWARHASRARARTLLHDRAHLSLARHTRCCQAPSRSHQPRGCRVRCDARPQRGEGAATSERQPADLLVSTPPDDVQCVSTGSEVTCVVGDGESGPDADRGPLSPPRELEAESTLGGLVLLVLPFFLWGSSMAGMKLVLDDVSPLLVAASRLVPSGALLVAYAAAMGRPQPRGIAAWASVAVFALVDGTLFQGALAEGLTRTSAGLGSVIIDSQPLTVSVLAALFFGESISSVGVLGLVLGLAGLVVLELPPLGEGGSWLQAASDATTSAGSMPLWSRGEAWMFLAAQAMALGTVWVRVLVRTGTDPVMATGWHMILGGLPLLALSAVREPDALPRLLHDGLSLQDVGLLSYVSVLGGAVAYGLFFRAAAQGSLVRLSALTFLTPLFAALCGYAALGETLTQQQLCGAGITLVGVLLVNRRSGGDS